MRCAEELRRETLNEELERDYPNTWELLNEASELLDIYYIQCMAATKAQTLGLCKLSVQHALDEDV
jgi:hypothetical protein